MASTPFCPPCRCPGACRSPLWQSARPARATPPCSPPRFSPLGTARSSSRLLRLRAEHGRRSCRRRRDARRDAEGAMSCAGLPRQNPPAARPGSGHVFGRPSGADLLAQGRCRGRGGWSLPRGQCGRRAGRPCHPTTRSRCSGRAAGGSRGASCAGPRPPRSSAARNLRWWRATRCCSAGSVRGSSTSRCAR